MNKLLMMAGLIFVLFIAACAAENEEIAENTDDNIEMKQNADEHVSWEDKILEIASNDSEASAKYSEIEQLIMRYEPTPEEIKQFETDIVASYKGGNYLSDLNNHQEMLTNIFKAATVERYYDDEKQLPIDSFAFDYFQNLKYTYRGVDSVDSDSVKSNEEQMNKALEKMN